MSRQVWATNYPRHLAPTEAHNIAEDAVGGGLGGATPVGGDLTGTVSNAQLAVVGAGGVSVNNGTSVPVITYDTKGRVTVVSSIPIAFPLPPYIILNGVGSIGLRVVLATLRFSTGWTNWRALIAWGDRLGGNTGGGVTLEGAVRFNNALPPVIDRTGGTAIVSQYGDVPFTNFSAVQTPGDPGIELRYADITDTQWRMVFFFTSDGSGGSAQIPPLP